MKSGNTSPIAAAMKSIANSYKVAFNTLKLDSERCAGFVLDTKELMDKLIAEGIIKGYSFTNGGSSSQEVLTINLPESPVSNPEAIGRAVQCFFESQWALIKDQKCDHGFRHAEWGFAYNVGQALSSNGLASVDGLVKSTRPDRSPICVAAAPDLVAKSEKRDADSEPAL